MPPKRVRQVIMQWTFCVTFSEHFPKIDFWMHFGGPLAPFWLPLAPFWLPLAPFWFPFPLFSLPFDTIWRSFAHPGIRFSHFELPQRHFIFFLCISHENLKDIKDFHATSHENKSVYARGHGKLPYAPLPLQSTQFS